MASTSTGWSRPRRPARTTAPPGRRSARRRHELDRCRRAGSRRSCPRCRSAPARRPPGPEECGVRHAGHEPGRRRPDLSESGPVQTVDRGDVGHRGRHQPWCPAIRLEMRPRVPSACTRAIASSAAEGCCGGNAPPAPPAQYGTTAWRRRTSRGSRPPSHRSRPGSPSGCPRHPRVRSPGGHRGRRARRADLHGDAIDDLRIVQPVRHGQVPERGHAAMRRRSPAPPQGTNVTSRSRGLDARPPSARPGASGAGRDREWPEARDRGARGRCYLRPDELGVSRGRHHACRAVPDDGPHPGVRGRAAA